MNKANESAANSSTRKKVQSGVLVDNANHVLIYIDVVGQRFKMSDEITITKAVKNLDSQEIVLTFNQVTPTLNNNFEGTLTDLKVSRIYMFLTENGVWVNEELIPELAKYLSEIAFDLMRLGGMGYVHSRLGWGNSTNMDEGFFASKSIGAKYLSTLTQNEDNFLGKNGDRAVYDEMIKTEVLPNKSLHLPFVLAFTAPIVPLMFDKSACPVLLTNFAGKSSMGKSTSMSLIASVWGRGMITNQHRSVAKTFASTQNGFEATVNQNFGLPVLFDDYSTAADNISFGKLIYTLAQGESKIRCTQNGKIHKPFQWRTFIGLTGESSIFDKAGNNLGLRPRIVEFKNEKWTVSKANSINITKVVLENYGFYGEEFVEKLMSKTKSQLDKLYDDCDSIMNQMLPPKDNVSDRIQTRLTLIRMTAVLVKELMGFNIDVDYITDFLVKNELKRQDSLSIYDLAKETLANYINKNLTSFVRFDKKLGVNHIPSFNIVGRIYKGRQGHLVAIMAEEFKNLMSRFNDREAILERWRDEKFLICEDGRFTKKVSITNYAVPPRCYVFLYDGLKDQIHQELLNDSHVIDSLEDEDIVSRSSDEPEKVITLKGQKYVALPKPIKLDAIVSSKTELHDHNKRNKKQNKIFADEPEKLIDFDALVGNPFESQDTNSEAL